MVYQHRRQRNASDKATRANRGEPIGRGTQYTRPQARRTAPKFKKIQTAPEKLPDYIADGDRVLIEAAFEQGEFICIGTTFENEQG